MENNWYRNWLTENKLTKQEVFRHFGVPVRTQENWIYNANSTPNYVFNLLKFAFEHSYDRQHPQ